MTSPEYIEARAKAFADARRELAAAMEELEDELRRARRRRLPRIKRLAALAAAEHDILAQAIDTNRALFVKPRSRLFHGIRVGLQKGKGKLVIASPAAVVKAIRKHFPDRLEDLVKVTETPLKGPLQRLSAADLKRLGVEIEDAGDEVLIKPADSEIDKLVEALLEEPAEASADGSEGGS